ncbi:SDR family oxidoreductase [Streptomyces sindenensis]|uniref:SDR family oxidoreductase n=1 Tax=Streptomyces sindenensis TaxID=67363 RepID=A0ABW6EJV8_9ACTN
MIFRGKVREARFSAPEPGHRVGVGEGGGDGRQREVGLWDVANEPEKLAMAIAMTSLGRLGRPEDLADVVAFLAGPDGRWLTGQNIRVDGGVLRSGAATLLQAPACKS